MNERDRNALEVIIFMLLMWGADKVFQIDPKIIVAVAILYILYTYFRSSDRWKKPRE